MSHGKPLRPRAADTGTLTGTPPEDVSDSHEPGLLDKFVLGLQHQADNQLAQLEEAGLYPHEAWEIVKDIVLLPTEKDVPNLGEARQPYTD